ncbi:DUF1028 domain-containing protein [Lutibaculum baratangense]|uniref:DUF1028 domain-containing protein n=1 Tax=Lutibaculum baratangense TaxID=1358440 RepID=UPI00058FF0A9|nr:DUF1028 domain-containing protein [Lutibaculum baratangense]
MTWSIIAREPATGRLGIAAASRFFALGARVPFVETGVGIVATQALLNPLYGRKGLALLREGHTAQEAVDLMVAADDGREARQVHAMDARGGVGAFTGSDCVAWCGHITGTDCSAAGNMLAGPEVIEATVAAYESRHDLPMARRLIAAMMAGEAAGGDMRGRQSASLIVLDEQEYSELDFRVDDHEDPLAELTRLEQVSRERWVHFRRFLPTRENPAGITDRSRIDAEIAAATARKEP